MTSVTVKHRFAASAERVYDAWIDPEMARRFLFVTATGEIVQCDMDTRVGGKFAIVARRNGEDVLHEGAYFELDRPRRIVFTLRVPKYSPDEDRITIDIEPLAQGCMLTLTTQTADEWADDTKLGWTMILDVLDESLPGEVPTCGAGLAQHAGVHRRVAIYLGELAQTLELHREMLVLDDPASKGEDEVYRDLAARFRDIGTRLQDAADRMAARRELPMGAHDGSKWTDKHMKAFSRFVHEQGALASVLRVAAARDEQMLGSMQVRRARIRLSTDGGRPA
ncbi:MAG: SRPBCC domain-containing protein [Burkholderiaceae bacterium]|nr:SRPBCC domain-containing protein [Burkholderiaceae bacterium]